MVSVHYLLPFTGLQGKGSDSDFFICFSPDQYLHKLIRPHKPFLPQAEESQLLPIEQMIHFPIFFLHFSVQLTLAHPYLSCTGEPRDVALSVLSREEGPPFQLLATLLMQLRRLLASLATPHCLLFHLVSTNIHRCLSVQLVSPQPILELGFGSSCQELLEAHAGPVLPPAFQVLRNVSPLPPQPSGVSTTPPGFAPPAICCS